MDKIGIEAAEALLDMGVSLPFKDIKIPFTSNRFTLRLTMKRPCLGNQIRIARLYMTLGVTYETMLTFDKHEQMLFLAKHGKTISKMISLVVLRGGVTGLLFSSLLAWLIRWCVNDKFIAAANTEFVHLLGTKNFMNIIRSCETANPLKPRLSQRKKGS